MCTVKKNTYMTSSVTQNIEPLSSNSSLESPKKKSQTITGALEYLHPGTHGSLAACSVILYHFAWNKTSLLFLQSGEPLFQLFE